ncbi:CMD domain-containing protein [uncultured Klebsiella sp.]|uniref:CMD domain-containing protein n=1 Tax=uncultured Klebsiella sp. TaxID=284011 RepID=UPI002804E9D6|nr:CMD domain-containing protein [uncultured Klebsiella sp.]
MEQRRIYGKNHWYHETQATICPVDVLPLVPEAADVEDRFLLDLVLPDDLRQAHARWLTPARQLADALFPASVNDDRLPTFNAYDRLSTALTAAQVYGVQRLCNHYAARLAPLPGPDSSRESNRRLAQMTQYARQLASSPWVINAQARRQLDEVGLSRDDIILINQIIGFVGFQASAIAALQAAQGYPVRWLPGMSQQEDAPEESFISGDVDWEPGIDDYGLGYENDEYLSLLAKWQNHPGLSDLAPLLAIQGPPLDVLEQLLAHLSEAQPFAAQAALVSARINGSISCFNAWAARCPDLAPLTAALRGNEPDIHRWGKNHPIEYQILHSARLLTRAPDRFSTDRLTLLIEQGLSRTAAIDLLVWCGLCGWMNRLKIALGNVPPQT